MRRDFIALTIVSFFIFCIFSSQSFAAVSSNSTKTKNTASLTPIVVTATRVPVKENELPDSITVITKKDIETEHVSSLYQILEGEPSITVKRTGWLGQWTYVRMRGGKNQDIAVLVNGIRIFDPTSPANDFGDMWSIFNLTDVNKIEIVRGPQSSLYGSNAMSGVIQIFTPEGGGPFHTFAKVSYGRYQTKRGAVGVKGQAGPIGYYMSYSGINTKGLYKDSKYRNTTFDTNFNTKPFKDSNAYWLNTFKISLYLRYTYAFLNYPQWDWSSFQAYNDPQSQKRTTLWINSLHFTGKLRPNWDWRLILAYTFDKRDYWDPNNGILAYTPEGNPVYDSYFRGLYKGRTYPVSFQTDIHFGTSILTLGAEYYKEQGNFFSASSWGTKRYSGKVGTRAYYVNLFSFLWNRVGLNVGGRIDDHDQFGTFGTWKIGAVVNLFAGLKLKGNIATGFRAPSLFNLYDPRYGNPDLSPERSVGGDIGFRQDLLNGKVNWSITYFNTHYKKRISFNYATWHYYNCGTANVDGVEVITNIKPLTWLSLGINYTYTNGEENNKNNLALVPHNELGCRVITQYKNFSSGIYFIYEGRKLAYDQTHEIPGYGRVDLTFSYTPIKHLELFARVQNLFNAKYESGAGYKSPRQSIFAGLKVSY